MWIYSIRGGHQRGCQVSITHLGTPGEGARPGGLCPPRCPSPAGLGSRNSLYWYKKSSQSFIPFRELLFLHKSNTMVVLLKIGSVRVSFIQIMEIRVQNKRKSIRKSRYNGHVSTPPSLNLCLSSSNSVDKLKVKKKNFYELLFSCFVNKLKQHPGLHQIL